MEIQQLRHFLAVIEHGSICSAAEATNITQSGLSRSLKNLENGIGLPLVKRGPRGVEPTAYGISLIGRAKLIINERDRAVDDLRAVRLAKSGTIKIGMTPNFSLYFAADVIASFSASRPNVDFQMTTGPVPELLAMLTTGHIDFAVALLGPDQVLGEGLGSETLFESASLVLAHRDHPLASQRNIRIEQLAAANWALIDSATFRMSFARFFDAAGFAPPRQVLRTNSIALLLQCMEKQELLTVLPRVTTRNKLAADLVKLDAPIFGALAHASFIYRSEELLLTPAMKNLMQVFRKEAARLMAAESVAGAV